MYFFFQVLEDKSINKIIIYNKIYEQKAEKVKIKAE